MKTTVSLRFFALSQVFYETGRYLHDALNRRIRGPKKTFGVTAVDGTSFGNGEVVQGHALSDLLPSCRELLTNSVLGGHVNPHLFCGVSSDNYPLLDDDSAVADDVRLLNTATLYLLNVIDMGVKRSGYLPSFALAQLGHMLKCRDCASAVLKHIREGLQTRNVIRDLLVHGGIVSRKSIVSR